MAGACLTFAHLFSFQVSYADLPPASSLAAPSTAYGTKMLMDAASLAMGFVKKATYGQPSFQLLVPNTKALSLAASSAESAKEWISALEDSIEYANNQGTGNQSKQAAAQMNQGRPQQYDNGYMISHSNRLQNPQLTDRTTLSTNPVRSAGPSTQQYCSQLAADQPNGNRQQMYMDKAPYNQEYRGAESYTGMQGHERTDSSEYKRQNPRLMSRIFETNQASTQDYHAPYPASGLRNDRLPIPRNIDSSYAGGPSNMFVAPRNTSSKLAPCPDAYERRDAYSELSYQDSSFYMDPQSNYQQRVPIANNPNVEYPNAKTQFGCSRNPYNNPLVTPQNSYNRPLGGVSDGIFHGSPISGQECPPSGNYRPNINYGGFACHPSDSTQFNNGGREMKNRSFCNASQGNFASQSSHQHYNNSTEAFNRNKAVYDPWASRMDMKDSDSD